MGQAPKVFISYSWEDDQHNNWVKQLADRLIENGVDTTLDQYDLKCGDRLSHFMEREISWSDFVLIICTEIYKRKADAREAGVGYEGHIISAQLYNGEDERKFIPILRQGSFRTAYPEYLSGKKGIVLTAETSKESYEMSFQELLEALFKIDRKPILGQPPSFFSESEKNHSGDRDAVPKNQSASPEPQLTEIIIPLEYYEGFCIGEENHGACTVHFDEEANKLISAIDFGKTSADTCATVIFTDGMDLSEYHIKRKNLSFLIKASETIKELEVECRLKNGDTRKEISVSSNWETKSIPLSDFRRSTSEWQNLKEIKFLLRRFRNNGEGGTIELKNIKIG